MTFATLFSAAVKKYFIFKLTKIDRKNQFIFNLCKTYSLGFEVLNDFPVNKLQFVKKKMFSSQILKIVCLRHVDWGLPDVSV